MKNNADTSVYSVDVKGVVAHIARAKLKFAQYLGANPNAVQGVAVYMPEPTTGKTNGRKSPPEETDDNT